MGHNPRAHAPAVSAEQIAAACGRAAPAAELHRLGALAADRAEHALGRLLVAAARRLAALEEGQRTADLLLGAQAMAGAVATAGSLADGCAALGAHAARMAALEDGSVWLSADGRGPLTAGPGQEVRSSLDGRPIRLSHPELCGRVNRERIPLALTPGDPRPRRADTAGAATALAVPFAFRLGGVADGRPDPIAILEITGRMPVDLAAGNVVAALGAALSLAAPGLRALALQSIEELRWRDALTRLWNKGRLTEDLRLACRNSIASAGTLSVLFIDLDHFKAINDSHGHGAGDEVLREIAAVIAAGLRESDQAYRYGGEEICVLLPDTDTEGAAEVAERIRERIRARYAHDRRGIRTSASIGVASFIPGQTLSASDLLAAADRAVYAAKAAGRDLVWVAGEPDPRRLATVAT